MVIGLPTIAKASMLYGVLADLIVVVHLAFVLFAVLGGLLALRWKSLAWIQVPAFLWATLIEFAGWVCPLTPLENWLLEKSGDITYPSGFIEHYILPLLYPAMLTRSLQIILGLCVLAVNLGIYAWVLWRPTQNRVEKS
jgi:hypothetical protein